MRLYPAASVFIFLSATIGLSGCPSGQSVHNTPSVAPVTAESSTTFKDMAAAAGIRFVHNTGAFGKYWMPETMGSGCAWLDYNGDGRPDLYLVNGTDWAGH